MIMSIGLFVYCNTDSCIPVEMFCSLTQKYPSEILDIPILRPMSQECNDIATGGVFTFLRLFVLIGMVIFFHSALRKASVEPFRPTNPSQLRMIALFTVISGISNSKNNFLVGLQVIGLHWSYNGMFSVLKLTSRAAFRSILGLSSYLLLASLCLEVCMVVYVLPVLLNLTSVLDDNEPSLSSSSNSIHTIDDELYKYPLPAYSSERSSVIRLPSHSYLWTTRPPSYKEPE
jgi:hypothetical protein